MSRTGSRTGGRTGGGKKNLGRGLSALLGDDNQDYAELDQLRLAKPVPIEQIHPGRYQPRRSFDPEEMEALVESIRAQGVLQPILVRRDPDDPSNFEIIAGERRWRAAQQVPLHEIPVLIKDLSDSEALQVALIENVQRQDLTPVEEAIGFRRLMDDFGYKQDDLAKIIGKSRSHIANTLRLLSLPDEIKDLIQKGNLSAGHGRALIGANNPIELARKIVAEGLNVRQAERLKAPEKPKPSDPPPKPAGPSRQSHRDSAPDADTAALERDLSEQLGLSVRIRSRGAGGEITFRYQSLEQLDDLLYRMTDNGQTAAEFSEELDDPSPEDGSEESLSSDDISRLLTTESDDGEEIFYQDGVVEDPGGEPVTGLEDPDLEAEAESIETVPESEVEDISLEDIQKLLESNPDEEETLDPIAEDEEPLDLDQLAQLFGEEQIDDSPAPAGDSEK